MVQMECYGEVNRHNFGAGSGCDIVKSLKVVNMEAENDFSGGHVAKNIDCGGRTQRERCCVIRSGFVE